MLFPVIKIKDTFSDVGKERIVGTNSHDMLYVDEESGGIQYLNLQCSEGTKKYGGESSYEFIKRKNEYDWLDRIEFVTFEELAEMYLEQAKKSCEDEKKVREWIKKIKAQREEMIDEAGLNEDDGIYHTGGTLI